MKTGRIFGILLVLFAVSVVGCGYESTSTEGGNSGDNVGGTETGSTDAGGIANVATKIENVASALVPDMESSASSSLSAKAVSYGASEDWDAYLEETNLTVLTDIFGPNEDLAPITRIRVLVNQFATQVESILSTDSELDCSGASSLNEGDTIELPFYGDVSNGTSDDRVFDCISVYENSGSMSGDSTTLYGQDSDNVIHFVYMQDTTSTNTTDTEERGSTTRNLSITYAEYAEAASEDDEEQMVGYLELKYAQLTWYCGPDEEFDTSDDVVFKSRSRITGKANVTEAGVASLATGDFTVTKYDVGNNESGGGRWNYITKSIGRGSYSAGDYSIFNVDPNQSSLAGKAGIYCIEGQADSMPAYAESTNCEAYEEAYAWTDSVFPFTVTPAIEEVFEDKAFFEGDDTDMIADDGSNFTIPTYTTAEAGE